MSLIGLFQHDERREQSVSCRVSPAVTQASGSSDIDRVLAVRPWRSVSIPIRVALNLVSSGHDR